MSFKTALSILAILNLATAALAQTSIYKAAAFNEEGKLVYREVHKVTFQGTRVTKSETQYLAPSGNVIATMFSNYEVSLKAPDYEFHDLVRNYKEGLIREGSQAYVYTNHAGKVNKERLNVGPNLYACQGWHYYLVAHLESLAKKDLELELLIPSQGRSYDFVIQGSSFSTETVKANLKMSNWLYSMFAPELNLTYDRRTKQLLSYEGPSNIKDNSGETYDKVIIKYDYSATK